MVDMAPMTVLSRSAAFMAKADFIIENRSDNSITFSKNPTMGGGMKALMYANVFLNPDTVTQDVTAWNTMDSWRATLVVAPTGDGKTEVTVGSNNNGGSLLDYWLKNDVLKEENPNPLAEIKGHKATLYILNYCVVVHAGSAFKRWQEGPFHMSEIKSVNLKNTRRNNNTAEIENYDGEVIRVFGINDAQAEQAKTLIEYRMKVFQEEPEAVEGVEETAPATDNLVLDIPNQIGKLAELRDRGILSSEEFETKKAELLDRM
jgi:hypothetical protein